MCQIWTSCNQKKNLRAALLSLELFCFELVLETIFTKYCLCPRWWAQDCDGWPLAHRELIHPLTGLRSYAKLKFFWLVTKGSSPTNDRMKGGWTLTENKNKTRYGRTQLGKVWRGWGIESRRMKKKNHEREHFVEKIVHSEHPRKKLLLYRPAEVFHRNFSNAHQRADCSKKNFRS